MPQSAADRAFTVPFGHGEIEFHLPDGMSGSLVASNDLPPLPDPGAAAHDAVAAPVAGPRLSDLARGVRSVCIAVTDATRACPDHLLAPPLLAELERAGVADDAIT
ncbi:MAG TPA: lactate racemase domain-containing protein, partial [Thermomicrobiales bacterium]|nr:lactate racemase domain-containing protein [Thermomicrobiales bacterium]